VTGVDAFKGVRIGTGVLFNWSIELVVCGRRVTPGGGGCGRGVEGVGGLGDAAMQPSARLQH